MNRKADIKVAVKALEQHVDFNIDARVHVFETTIRVLGGLLSGHVLLLRWARLAAWAAAAAEGGRAAPAAGRREPAFRLPGAGAAPAARAPGAARRAGRRTCCPTTTAR
jgi:hypothetical protein